MCDRRSEEPRMNRISVAVTRLFGMSSSLMASIECLQSYSNRSNCLTWSFAFVYYCNQERCLGCCSCHDTATQNMYPCGAGLRLLEALLPDSFHNKYLQGTTQSHSLLWTTTTNLRLLACDTICAIWLFLFVFFVCACVWVCLCVRMCVCELCIYCH